MFSPERIYQSDRNKVGVQAALRSMGDIHPRTPLHAPRQRLDNARPSLDLQSLVLDINEHFLELSNPGEFKRSTLSVMWLLAAMVFAGSNIGAVSALHVMLTNASLKGMDYVALFCLAALAPCTYAFLYFLRPSEAFLTALRARYRFNRSTGKVYIVRPRKFGGNAVLDWSRVRAHVQWRPPLPGSDLEGDPTTERHRERLEQPALDHAYLMLYWPPLDPADPQRRGEDLIFVGHEGSGANLWEYLRTFMNKGLGAVPEPQPFEYLRKGFSTARQAQMEVMLQPTLVKEQILGQSTATGLFLKLDSYLWRYNHVLGERMAYWPTFPEAWNSDCGQRRREDGIGPEEPLRWTPTGPVLQGEIFANECTDLSEASPAQWARMLAWTALHIAIGTALLVVPIWWMRS
ncbi:MFS transporter [Aquincola tertiaricarbonis]|uniref:MFS transporter n=1 Tax=Aquincola tertiaricarbonis TaxID=391953 RepID=A0ABY4S5N1_AQUTE|nr:MFS transporter [Aquincola tertiaricarbonis]URI08299.1 MFS transporter [Aquincola tertiaricarbonis]